MRLLAMKGTYLVMAICKDLSYVHDAVGCGVTAAGHQLLETPALVRRPLALNADGNVKLNHYANCGRRLNQVSFLAFLAMSAQWPRLCL